MLNGFHREIDKCNHMMRMQVQKVGETIILYLLVFIVWKPSVLHVGAVHDWTLFDKSESPTNILIFLDAAYPTPDVRPDYVYINKGCQVLCTSISNAMDHGMFGKRQLDS